MFDENLQIPPTNESPTPDENKDEREITLEKINELFQELELKIDNQELAETIENLRLKAYNIWRDQVQNYPDMKGIPEISEYVIALEDYVEKIKGEPDENPIAQVKLWISKAKLYFDSGNIDDAIETLYYVESIEQGDDRDYEDGAVFMALEYEMFSERCQTLYKKVCELTELLFQIQE